MKCFIRHFSGWSLLSHLIPIASRDHGLGLIADRKPALGALPGLDVDRSARPSILVRAQPGSTALLSTSGQRRATAKASAVTYNLLSP